MLTMHRYRVSALARRLAAAAVDSAPHAARRPLATGAAHSGSVTAVLNYQDPVPGRRIGRYIGRPDEGELLDVFDPHHVEIRDARQLQPAATLASKGFELRTQHSKVSDFRDDAEVQRVYYPEVQALVAAATGASEVIVFDHTVRDGAAVNLNNLGAKGMAAGSVSRVHCDYTEDSAPLRVKQLREAESYTGCRLSPDKVESILAGRFAFINVWRNIRGDSPILTKPLAVCDPASVPKDAPLLYELAYAERTGLTYSLPYAPEHRWYHYPRMTKEECLLFKVYDSARNVPRFVFHAAFDDPGAPADAPMRTSIETRTIAVWDDEEHRQTPARPVFFDMVHSNNAARVRLWLKLKGLEGEVDTVMTTYLDLKDPAYITMNPLKKVPAMILPGGKSIYESQVLLDYLEDKYGGLRGPNLVAATPEQRAQVDLLVRYHDVYVSSPNCLQPGFSHTQGAMYLAPYATKHCPPERAMDPDSRAAKLADLWQHLHWLEAEMVGPFLAGDHPTHADLTWFPTAVFMEYLLPRVFGWPPVFREQRHFPRLSAWLRRLEAHPAFAEVRTDIWDWWVARDGEGMLDPIRKETAADSSRKWTYP